MNENKIQVKRQVVPSFLGSYPRITWGITCPDEDCHSYQEGINAPPSAGWDSQEVAMRVAVRHAEEKHPKPFAPIGMGSFYLQDGMLTSLGTASTISAGTVVAVDGSGRVRPVRPPGSEVIWTDSIGRELRAKYSRFHGLMLCVDGHWVYLGGLDEGIRALDKWIQDTMQPVEKFSKINVREEEVGWLRAFWDWLMGR